MSSRQLFAFLEICRLRSFAKAAETIPMSPSGVSMLVRELEQQVGARLFDRTTRSLTLTQAGEKLQQVAGRIVGELRSLDAVIGGAEAAVSQRLDVAATPMVAATLLPQVVRSFATSHPQVRVQLADVDVTAVRNKVLQDEADIGLGFFVKPAVGLLRQPLCSFRLMCISPPSGVANGVDPSRPWSSLEGLPLVSLPSDNPIQALIEKHLGSLGSKQEDRPRMNLIGTLIGMVQAGHGHAVVPSFVLDDCLRHGLRVSMLVAPAVSLDLHLVSHRGTQVKPVALEFAQALKRAAARLAG